MSASLVLMPDVSACLLKKNTDQKILSDRTVFSFKCFFGIAVFVFKLHNFVCLGYSNIQERVMQGFRYWSTYKTRFESSVCTEQFDVIVLGH